MTVAEIFFFALLGGVMPALIWLWFWIREDSLKPEPKFMILISFVAGMIVVPIALFVEIWINDNVFLKRGIQLEDLETIGLLSIFAVVILAAVEELGKYLAALFSSLKTKFNDEPVDSMIYLISAGLGFAALENTLFLVGSINSDFSLNAIFLSNNLRFMGATLLHVISSGIVGGIIANAYFSSKSVKFFSLVLGLVTGTILHALFNLSIIVYSDVPFKIFSILWAFAILLILIFEKVKRIKKIT